MLNQNQKADANSAASGEDTLMSVGQNDTELYQKMAQSVEKENRKKNNSISE